MKHQPFITLPWQLERAPPPFEKNEIKSPESLARYIIQKYTKKGDHIFDPFSGLGTTLFVAEEQKRLPFGFEAEEKRYEWVAGQLEHWTQLICDDTAKLSKYKLPKMDLVLTSPPYMPRHHRWNPLYGGDPQYAGYDKYLKRMAFIFSKVATVMKKNALLIIQADNLQHGRIFTPLVRDLAHCLNTNFVQTGETTIQWETPKPDYPHTTLLLFKKK